MARFRSLNPTHRRIDASTHLRVPVGRDAARWRTTREIHVVLGVARTVTSANRLLEALDVFQGDLRVQVVFAVDPTSPFVHGVAERLTAAGGRLVPWSQVRSLRFDLVLTATENARLDGVVAPVVVLPHGVGFHKYVPDAFTKTHRVSGVVPRQRAAEPTMVLSHPDQARQLGPGADTRVIGDPTLERMLAGAHLASTYRAALGATGKRLVVLSSTWGSGSLWGSRGASLPEALLAALPYDEFAVALILHPNVWFGHSPWQVRTWLARALDAGLILIPPDDGWQATICAADLVIGDHGSVTLYAAALGKPLLLGAFGDEVVPGTAMASLGKAATRLDPRGAPEMGNNATRPDPRGAPEMGKNATRADLRGALELAKPVPEVAAEAFIPAGGSTARLRELLYQRLGLPEPEWAASVRAWPAPSPEIRTPRSFVIYVDESVRRYSGGEPVGEKGLRVRASYADELDHDLISNASIVVARDDTDLAELLERHPGAIMAASPSGALFRDGTSEPLFPDGASETFDTQDPMCAAAAVYARWRAKGPLVSPPPLRSPRDDDAPAHRDDPR